MSSQSVHTRQRELILALFHSENKLNEEVKLKDEQIKTLGDLLDAQHRENARLVKIVTDRTKERDEAAAKAVELAKQIDESNAKAVVTEKIKMVCGCVVEATTTGPGDLSLVHVKSDCVDILHYRRYQPQTHYSPQVLYPGKYVMVFAGPTV